MAGTDALAMALEGIDALLAKQCDGDGVSAQEIADHTGRSVSAVREYLRKQIRAGAWELSGRRHSTALDGKSCWTPVYRPVEKRK